MYSRKKPITPFSPLFLLNLALSLHIRQPFLLTYPIHFLLYIHYPLPHRTTPVFLCPLRSSFLTPERTTSCSLLVCLLNSATHHSSFRTLPPHIFLPPHPFTCLSHVCYQSSSLRGAEISSLYPQATNCIITSPLTSVYLIILHLLPSLTPSPAPNAVLLQ